MPIKKKKVKKGTSDRSRPHYRVRSRSRAGTAQKVRGSRQRREWVAPAPPTVGRRVHLPRMRADLHLKPSGRCAPSKPRPLERRPYERLEDRAERTRALRAFLTPGRTLAHTGRFGGPRLLRAAEWAVHPPPRHYLLPRVVQRRACVCFRDSPRPGWLATSGAPHDHTQRGRGGRHPRPVPRR